MYSNAIRRKWARKWPPERNPGAIGDALVGPGLLLPTPLPVGEPVGVPDGVTPAVPLVLGLVSLRGPLTEFRRSQVFNTRLVMSVVLGPSLIRLFF